MPLLLVTGISRFVQIFIFQLIPPIILSFTTEDVLGFTSSFCGIGFFIGSVVAGLDVSPVSDPI
jgi:hypothetical protein